MEVNNDIFHRMVWSGITQLHALTGQVKTTTDLKREDSVIVEMGANTFLFLRSI